MVRPVRVRVAPSPTGDPHVGTAYMSLFNKAFADRHGGRFVLRIEDTDQSRFNEGSVQEILDSLAWLGLSPDEGPGLGGNHGPYVQTERRELYGKHASLLIDTGKAYRCFCTRERLEQMRADQSARKLPPRYDRHCAQLAADVIERNLADGLPFVIRMLMPSDGTTTFNDMIRGEISFENALLDDQVLLKSDGLPTYHLAVVVDDHFMEISHVVRAEEWISSTPKHVLLYQYFGWEVPAFAHMPLLRNADRSKISKRKNNTSLRWYREQGFLPEAMLNFLALMGWSMPDGREMFGYDDVVREVSFERISTTGPVFDLVKLTAINGKYIRQLRVDELHRRVMPFVPESMDADRVRKIVPVIHDRLTRLGEFVELTGFFFAPPDYDAIALVPKKGTTELARTIMAEIRTFLGELATPWNREEWEAGLRNLAAARNVKPGDVFMMLRVAVTGSNVSPPLFESVEVLGADETRARVDSALNKLGE